jgi:hypothetical protein
MMMATYFSMSFTGSGLERNCGLDQHIEHFAFDIDGAPKIDHAAIDYQIDFVQMPSRMGRELKVNLVRPTTRRSVGKTMD